MDEIVLEVGPVGSGWAVDCEVLQPSYFQTGAQAEAAARRLAIQLSGAGRDVRMVVRNQAELLVAIHHYYGS